MKKVSIQSSKYENWFFYAIYNTNFHLVNSLRISLDKQEALAYSFQIQVKSIFNGANFLPQVNEITYSIPIGKTDILVFTVFHQI